MFGGGGGGGVLTRHCKIDPWQIVSRMLCVSVQKLTEKKSKCICCSKQAHTVDSALTLDDDSALTQCQINLFPPAGLVLRLF